MRRLRLLRKAPLGPFIFVLREFLSEHSADLDAFSLRRLGDYMASAQR